jgi:cytochrome b pre-mRNA-processing protein 3
VLRLSRRPATARLTAERLHAAAVAQSREPALYLRLGAPDTIEGRFELLALHLILILDRLKGEGEMAAEIRQSVFDVFVSHLDGAMREMGVGDLAMAKRMRKLGAAFYGRMQAYSEAFAALPVTTPLAAVVARTVLLGQHVAPEPLAGYAATARDGLASQDVGVLLRGAPAWPAA